MDPFLHLGNRVLAHHSQLHNISGVPLLMEVEQAFAHTFLLQTHEVAARKPIEARFLACNLAHQVEISKEVVLLRHVEL